MDDVVAHADNVRPPNLRMSVGELPGHLARGFPNELTAFLAMSSMCPTYTRSRGHTGVQRCSTPDRECGH